MNKRLADLRAKLSQEGLDGLIVTRPDNQLYLSGFPGGEYLDATMLISSDHAWISTDSRYYEDVKQRAKDFQLFEAGYDRNKVLGEFANTAKPKVMGVEASHLTMNTWKDWSKAARKAGFKLKPTDGLVEKLRMIKEPEELTTIKRAVDLTDRAFGHFCAVVKPGITEKEASWIIEKYMRETGADQVAFKLIVAAGPNSALPHAVPGDRKLVRGEPIVIDIGCQIDHYNSDMTRTILLGQPDDQFKKVYDTVLKAQKAAEKKIKAGIKGKRADSFARSVIDKAGFGDQFGHGLGHGVGLAVHEGPRASKLSKDVYQPGMTLTIEPGIYVAGWGGVRIEDLVVIRENDVEILTQANKEPIIKI
ncbi:MAG: aminopeptidase P family protein [Chloroflexi bacterium]|nr:aminopeptidase P family protein [Chloroflexota bacterium]